MNLRYWYTGGLFFSAVAATIFMVLLIPASSPKGEKRATSQSSTVAKVTAISAPSPNLDLISANNLFNPYRGKPAPAEEAQKKKAKTQAPARFKFVLTGVFRSGEEYGALLVIMGNRANPTGKDELERADANIFLQGKEITEGYFLKEVRPDKVIITHNDEKIEVEMEKLASPDGSGSGKDADKSNEADKSLETDKAAGVKPVPAVPMESTRLKK